MEKNFYELFEINNNAANIDIIIAYRKKIAHFNKLNNISEQDINKIKLLKIGLYILTNHELRNQYDKKFQNINTPPPIQSIPSALNDNNDDNDLDSLFSVDNSWMEQINKSDVSINKRKSNLDGNEIGNRIFSLTGHNKKIESNFENELRKPLQGRENKK
jgi:DnaJ-class molecular chaperone